MKNVEKKQIVAKILAGAMAAILLFGSVAIALVYILA